MQEARDLFRKTCPPEQHEAWERLGGSIGAFTYGNIHVAGLPAALAASHVFTIGRFCSIAGGVRLFLCHDHNPAFVTTYPFNVAFSRNWPEARAHGGHPRSRGSIHVGNDVWLASEASIMSGVTIGDGAIVGHRSVVTKDIGPYEIWAGMPARKIRDRFDPRTRAALLRIKWWELSAEEIRPLTALLMSEDPGPLIEAVRGVRREQRLARAEARETGPGTTAEAAPEG